MPGRGGVEKKGKRPAARPAAPASVGEYLRQGKGRKSSTSSGPSTTTPSSSSSAGAVAGHAAHKRGKRSTFHSAKAGLLRASAGGPLHQHKQPTRKHRLVSHDVYEAADEEAAARKLLGHRSASGQLHLDEVDTYEYTLGEDGIASEDDEEIDEDAAFGESDEERFGAYFAPKSDEKATTQSHPSTIDLNEDDEGEEHPGEGTQEDSSDDMHDSEYDPEEMIQISDLLKDDEDVGAQDASQGQGVGADLLPTRALVPSSDDELAVTNFSSSDDDDTEDEKGDADDAAFIHRLTGSTLAAGSSNTTRQPGKRRLAAPEMSEAFAESEFNLSAARSGESVRGAGRDSGSKVDLATLLGALGNETNLGGVKKQLEGMAKKEATLLVPAPLPHRIQSRHERVAAYEETKKEVSKWVPLVKKNRETDHLVFPMNAAPAENVSNSALVSKFQPKTDMEREIQGILEATQLTEKSQQEYEELQLNKLNKEELLLRRAELAKMRSLLFHQEQKQKKIAKIKSKAYRKVHKKRKLDADGNTAAASGEEAQSQREAQEERDKREFERAQERMTLKHKNTSKWAKHILGRGKGADDHSRKALMEQLNKHEELKRKIAGRESETDSDADAAMGGTAGELAALAELEQGLGEETTGPEAEGVFGMKFMRRAAEKERAQSLQFLQEAKEELRRLEAGEDASEDDDEASMHGAAPSTKAPSTASERTGKAMHHNQGRMAFGGAPADSSSEARAELREEENDDDEGGALQRSVSCHPHHVPAISAVSEGPMTVKRAAHLFEVEPFVAPEDDVVLEASANRTALPAATSEGSKPVTRHAVSFAATAAAPSSNPRRKLTSGPASEAAEAQHRDGSASEADGHGGDDGDDDSAAEDGEGAMPDIVHEKHLTSLSQRELLALAFANDNVELAFAEEKEALAERDAPKEEDLTLPGWGSWAGAGCAPKQRVHVKKPGPGDGVAKHKRQDAKLKHVIINEKRAKKSVKYMIPQVPHGFDNRDQYERALQLPLGKEWNAQGVHKDLVQPRVRTKVGQVIHPLRLHPKK